MQKRLITLCTLLLALTASSVFAYSVNLAPPVKNSGMYFSFGAGFNLLQKQLFGSNNASGGGTIKYNVGWNGMTNIGYHHNAWRYEFSGTYLDNSISSNSSGNDSGNTSAIAYMANVLYNFNQKGTWMPYVGAGIGLVSIDMPNDLDDSDAFGYQGILGLSVKLSRHFALFTEYRYLGTSSFSTGNNIDSRYLNNLFDGGIRIYF